MHVKRAGKTRLFHMKGVDFTHFNTCCTLIDVVRMNSLCCLGIFSPQPEGFGLGAYNLGSVRTSVRTYVRLYFRGQ